MQNTQELIKTKADVSGVGYDLATTDERIDMATNPDYINFIIEAHKRGMTVSASVINEKYVADNLIAQGVDFIITDTVEVL